MHLFMTSRDMVYAFHNLFFLPTLLLFFIHVCHSWSGFPEYIEYRCADFNGTSLLFPFTNCSLPGYGYCVLKCKSGSTTVKCGGQELSYKFEKILPHNDTIILSYPELDNLNRDVCTVHQSESVILPAFSGPPFVSLKILHLQVFFRCPSNDTEDKSFWKIRRRNCGNTTVYGPLEDPQDEKFLVGCHKIELPSSVHNNFSVKYEFAEECKECPADRSRCFDPKTKRMQCPKRPQNPEKGGRKRQETRGGERQGTRGRKRQGMRGRLGIIVGTVVPGSLLIFLAIFILLWRRRKNKEGSSAFPSTSISFDITRFDLGGVTVFSYNELEEATNGFATDQELGEGGYGIVYYGKLNDGRDVAVKRLYQKNYKRFQQFSNEIQILTSLKHNNLVTLYGCTSRHSQMLLLVYEYVPNGTVADHLHGNLSGLVSWSTRMNIAIETAEALSYLHQRNIIHRDVKTNNILLDNSFSVKVADFGLSRLFPANVSHVSTAPQGTPGYLDPVYHHCYHLTEKSDVYSFGVVLVELISSLPAVDVGRDRDEINLSNYAMSKIRRGAFSELVDHKLGYETDFKVRRMTNMVGELAYQCLQQEREDRPSMDEVLQALKRILNLDYDALEEEEKILIKETTKVIRHLSLDSVKNGYVGRGARRKVSSSPISVMDHICLSGDTEDKEGQ